VEFEGLPNELSSIKKTVILLAEGKPADAVNLKSIKQLLTLKLRSFGYPEPEVELNLKKVNCGYALIVRVEKGYRLFVKRVSVVAPPPFKELALRLFSSLKGKAVNYPQIRELQEKLEEELVKRGYYNARVKVVVIPEKEKQPTLELWRPASLFVKVEPGKRYLIVFKGNRHFDDQTLKRLTTFASARSVDEFELENSRKKIEEFYKNSGFPFASVRVFLEEGPEEAKVIFEIKEGPFVVVKKVEVKGFNLKEKEIKKLLNKPYSLKKLKALERRIFFKLKKEGYLEARVSHKVTPDGVVVIEVRRGALFRVIRVEVSGDRLGCFKEVRLKLPAPLTGELLNSITDSLYSCYARRGYPDAKVEVKKVLIGKNEAFRNYLLKVKVEPGKFYRFCYIVVRGLKRTRLSAIKNLFIIEPGEPFSREKVVKQYSKLLDSRLFSSITIDDVKGKGCFSEVITLEEGALLRARGFIGYGTDSGYVVNGFASSTSPLGFGVKYFLFGNYRQKEGYDAVFKATRPSFPFKNYDTSYSVVRKEQIYESFTFDRLYYSLTFHRKASKHLTQDFSFKVSRSRLRDTSINADRETLERNLTYLQTYDKRDSISNPRRGYLSKTELTLAGLFMGGDASYYLVNERFNYLYPLSKKSVLSVRLGGGFIRPLLGKTVPIEDRFFLGGAESVRGYKYGTISPRDEKGNFIGGKAYGLFSLELRRLIAGNLEGALFFDSGQVFPSIKDFKLSGWYSSVGVGLRYLTPVGPLRIDYGYKLKKVPGQGSGRVHISFGFPF